MTSPTAKKDTKLGKWTYVAVLPWVELDVAPDPPPEPVTQTATVVAKSGTTVKMRAKPSTSCALYWDVPIGSTVIVDQRGNEWTEITYADRMGWMMTKFLSFEPSTELLWTAHIPFLTESQAQALLAQYPGSWMTSE